MRLEAQIPPPTDGTGPALADYAEALVLIEESASISRAELRHRVSGVGQIDEAELGLAFAEIRSRAGALAAVYPFDLGPTGEVMELRAGVDHTAYELMLLLSLDGAAYRAEGRYAEASSKFDVVVREALKAHVGPRSRAIRFGSSPLSDGRPPDFATAVEWLAGLLNLPVGAGEKRAARRDGGVDVIAWRPFADQLPAFPVLLAQNTVGWDFDRKPDDINLNLWTDWIGFGVKPARVLAVPYVMPRTDPKWRELKYSVAIALDRLRICDLLQEVDIAGIPEMADLQSWVLAERSALRTAIN